MLNVQSNIMSDIVTHLMSVEMLHKFWLFLCSMNPLPFRSDVLQFIFGFEYLASYQPKWFYLLSNESSLDSCQDICPNSDQQVQMVQQLISTSQQSSNNEISLALQLLTDKIIAWLTTYDCCDIVLCNSQFIRKLLMCLLIHDFHASSGILHRDQHRPVVPLYKSIVTTLESVTLKLLFNDNPEMTYQQVIYVLLQQNRLSLLQEWFIPYLELPTKELMLQHLRTDYDAYLRIIQQHANNDIMMEFLLSLEDSDLMDNLERDYHDHIILLRYTQKKIYSIIEFHTISPQECEIQLCENESETIKVIFYLLRNMIRCWDYFAMSTSSAITLSALDSFKYICNIPVITPWLHRAMSDGTAPNQLLFLSHALVRQEITSFLITIPSVAEGSGPIFNDFVDESLLAGMNEGSMTQLTPAENALWILVEKLYASRCSELGGPVKVLEIIRNDLRDLYHKQVAKVQTFAMKVDLPMEWKDFEEMGLGENQRKMALKSYYQHKIHTAYRYLLKPNPWLHKDAKNIDHKNKCSTFHYFADHIAFIYLAVSDEDNPSHPDIFPSIESRKENFFNTLADINRSNNWNEQRKDDCQADRPSCPAGVKRQLWQALFGHPRLTLVTRDLVELEFKDFLNAYWRKCLETMRNEAPKDFERLQVLYPQLIYCFDDDGVTSDDIKLLQGFNIPQKLADEWLQTMNQQHCDQFIVCASQGKDPVLNRLKINNFESPFECHIISMQQFAKEIAVKEVLLIPGV